MYSVTIEVDKQKFNNGLLYSNEEAAYAVGYAYGAGIQKGIEMMSDSPCGAVKAIDYRVEVKSVESKRQVGYLGAAWERVKEVFNAN